MGRLQADHFRVGEKFPDAVLAITAVVRVVFLELGGRLGELPGEVIRSTEHERIKQIENLRAFKKRNESRSAEALKRLQHVAVKNENVFTELMETVKYCSLGQITHALYEVGGQYRRSM